jgi:uncharacterized tellurite resistance protein B-like protein
MAWFESRDKKEAKSLVCNIWTMIAADGQVSPEELAYLPLVCERVGVAPPELERIVSAPDRIRFMIPEDPRKRLEHLLELVFVMMIDGIVHEQELRFVCWVGGKFGLSRRDVLGLVDGLVGQLTKEPAPQHDPPAQQRRKVVTAAIDDFLRGK